MINIKEIVESWARAKNPTEEEKLLAEKRLAICATCSFAGKPIFKVKPICMACGCPLDKKAYSPRSPNACPKGFWPE